MREFGWLREDSWGLCFSILHRTAFDKERLDAIREEMDYYDKSMGDDGIPSDKVVYEEVPAEGLFEHYYEEYLDEIKASKAKKGGGE